MNGIEPTIELANWDSKNAERITSDAVTLKKISIIIPVLNEEKNIPKAYAAVKNFFKDYDGIYNHEIIFTDNHSSDKSFPLLRELAKADPHVKAVRFSRNFGYQNSIYTGYALSTGHAVVQLDCDLQDPPSLISEFLKKWQEGNQVVYGIRRTRSEGPFITMLRRVFYRTINFLSNDELPHDAGDFRLVDRRVVEELKRIYDSTPYIRGTIASLGFQQVGVPYDRLERSAGESKFNFSSLMKLAMDGILNHSIVPLRLATYTGLLTFFLAVLLVIGYVTFKVFFAKSWPAGFTTTTTLLLVSMSLNALFLGILGEYLGRIYQQVKHRPNTVIEESHNL